MMGILIMLLISAVISLLVFIKLVLDLDKRIAKLERKIDVMQYQIDEVLYDIDIVNQNVLNNYGLLNQMKDKKTIK